MDLVDWGFHKSEIMMVQEYFHTYFNFFCIFVIYKKYFIRVIVSSILSEQ